MRNPENRRKRLREWFATRSIPAANKSYISQLLNGVAAFGEKTAINLEQTLGMPDGYLDTVEGASAFDESTQAVIKMMQSTDDEGRLRIKLGVTDILDQYELRKMRVERLRIADTVPAELLRGLAEIQDPDFPLALEAFLGSFNKVASVQKQK
ncbi:hypothetical protein ACO0LG_22565 [Undibacterium sp. Ji42W]|uniref:hypothetical protein n=1 Tax=Undibacterium sp. Ji42W TaxID=3413039 RepID=UPI003BF22C36